MTDDTVTNDTAQNQPVKAAASDSAVLSIDLAAVQQNYQHMQKAAGQAETAAVVKADGYGLGMAQVAEALAAAGCTSFFVAQSGEALALRQILPQAVIYVLNGLPPGAAAQFADAGLRPCLNSLAQIEEWQSHCRQTTSHPACLFVDTGFNRLGLSAEAVADLSDKPDLFEGWELSLIASHLACADTPEHPMNKAQLEAFTFALSQLPDAPASLANSGGVLLGAAYHFDMVRCGIALYGGSPDGTTASALAPVASLRAPILQIRNLSAGDSVGYGADFAATGEMTIGIVSLGYADGLGRHFGRRAGHAKVMLSGFDIPIIGRISMDSLAVDVTDCPQAAQIGDMVEIFGRNNPIDRLAGQGGSISYELLTSLGSRYNRLYTS